MQWYAMAFALPSVQVLLLACLQQLFLFAEGAAVLGVAPEDQAKYTGGEFRCFDGRGKPLPATAVNDEYCDCEDGSDEPGTGACAGQTSTVFFCRNEGSTARRVYASRVGDGICDCCDGSDEASLAKRLGGRTPCGNTCAAQGRLEAEANKKRIGELTRALQVKEETRKKALVERDTFAQEIKKLEAELPALEEKVKGLKVEADKEREVKRLEDEAKKATDNKGKDVWDSQACRWRQTGGCKPDGDREAHNDKKCHETIATGSSGYCDCNGNEQKDASETGYACEGAGPGRCADVCPAPGASQTSPEAPAGEEKPQVSEYAKWMEGAADKMSDDGKAAAEEKPQVSEYTKWMDGGEKMTEGEAKPAEPQATTTTTTSSEASKRSAIDEEREAENQARTNKDRTKELTDKTIAMSDSHLGFASLVGKTLSKRVAEFNYKITFFTNAIQDSTSLGKWEKWTGPRSATFEHGTTCWGGPERKLNVNFHCGLEEALIDAFEPSRCVYEASVTHPGACEEEDLKMLTEGTRIIAAHEEL